MGGVQPIRELDHFACSWKTLEKCAVPFYVHLVWKFVIIQTLICNLACPDGVLGTTSRPLISELKISVITWVSVPSPIFHSVCFPFRFSFRVSICPMRFRMIQFFFYKILRLNIYLLIIDYALPISGDFCGQMSKERSWVWGSINTKKLYWTHKVSVCT